MPPVTTKGCAVGAGVAVGVGGGTGADRARVGAGTMVRGGGGTRSSLHASAASATVAIMTASSRMEGRVNVVGENLSIFILLF